MTTGKQSAVHAQQNSDGTFELHVESSGEEHFLVDQAPEPPRGASKEKPWRKVALVGVIAMLVLGGFGLFWISQGTEELEVADTLEPVQGFRAYTGGAGAPAITKRPARTAVPVVEETEEEFEDESGGVDGEEEIRGEAVVPMRPPAVLENRVIEEVEESPEESGWELEEGEVGEEGEGVEEIGPDEQGHLLENIKKRGRLEQIERNALMNGIKLPADAIAPGKRHLALDPTLRKAGDTSRFSRIARTGDRKEEREVE